MTYDRSARLKKRSHTRLDRFGIFQLGREKGLGALDRWLLTTLAMLCDYTNGDYFGTITELAEDIGATRQAIGASLDRLHSAGLIQIVSDFGPKVQGHVRVLALHLLVVGATEVNRVIPRDKDEPHVRPYQRGNRAQTAGQSRANRGLIAGNHAVSQPLSSENANAQGSQRRRDEGSDVSRDAVALLIREFNGEEVSAEEVA
jgi:hypothetical protein